MIMMHTHQILFTDIFKPLVPTSVAQYENYMDSEFSANELWSTKCCRHFIRFFLFL